MKLLKILFAALGILFAISGILTVLQKTRVPVDAATWVGYCIGAFIPGTVCFALAWMFHKRQQRKERDKVAQELLESLPQ